jgi:hypothetical protein
MIIFRTSKIRATWSRVWSSLATTAADFVGLEVLLEDAFFLIGMKYFSLLGSVNKPRWITIAITGRSYRIKDSLPSAAGSKKRQKPNERPTAGAAS